MQHQIQFEATAFQHTVRIPDIFNVPDGVLLQVTLSFDDENSNAGVNLDADVFDYLNEKCSGDSEKLRILVNELLRKNIEIARLLS
jgi:hypothetical protein